MRQDKILTIISFGMLAAALAVHFGVAPLRVAQPRQLAVASFPEQVGAWQSNGDIPVPAVIKQKLPTARIVDRVYVNPAGQKVEMLLLTAARREDIHDPARCLPSQGWQMSNRRTIVVDGQKANAMTISQNGADVDAYFWQTGYFAPARPRTGLEGHLYSLRSRIISRQEGMSLFVRLMSANSPENIGALDSFARQITPDLDQLKRQALRPGETVDLSSGRQSAST